MDFYSNVNRRGIWMYYFSIDRLSIFKMFSFYFRTSLSSSMWWVLKTTFGWTVICYFLHIFPCESFSWYCGFFSIKCCHHDVAKNHSESDLKRRTKCFVWIEHVSVLLECRIIYHILFEPVSGTICHWH